MGNTTMRIRRKEQPIDSKEERLKCYDLSEVDLFEVRWTAILLAKSGSYYYQVSELGSKVDGSRFVHTVNGYSKENILVSRCVRSSIIISTYFPCISKTNSYEISWINHKEKITQVQFNLTNCKFVYNFSDD